MTAVGAPRAKLSYLESLPSACARGVTSWDARGHVSLKQTAYLNLQGS